MQYDLVIWTELHSTQSGAANLCHLLKYISYVRGIGGEGSRGEFTTTAQCEAKK